VSTHRFRAAIILLALTSSSKLVADSIVIDSVSGDANSLSASFSLTWDGPPHFVGLVSDGTWAGGSLQFRFGAGPDGFVTPGGVSEGVFEPTFVTTWNDGWGPILFTNTQFFLLNGQVIPLSYEINSVPWTANNITYLLTAGYDGTMIYNADGSGNADITFNFSRTAVPDSSTALSLLLVGLIALFLFGVVSRRGIINCGSLGSERDRQMGCRIDAMQIAMNAREMKPVSNPFGLDDRHKILSNCGTSL
jgi:hypothetical protein